MLTKADIYLHNPKGSNNRLAEESVARANNQRLFNSQNNNNGGYNTGSVYYYTGSKLQVEWTSQHSCQHPNNNCEFILQYMCHDLIRDGKSVKTIPLVNSDKNFQFGMHENWRHYKNCLMRERNRGLFIADQKLKKNQATHTRQNPGGTRYGYECAEERDYYPYWHPSPWKDIAVLTNNASRCLYYQQESQNNKSKWACTLNENDFAALSKNLKVVLPNNKEECEKFCFPEKSTNCKKAIWKEFPAHGLPPPECRENEYSEDNYLGNGPSGNAIRYNWTLPEIPGDNCVFRIRYNISTNDFSWDTDHKFNAPNPGTATKIDLSQEYFLNNTAKIRVSFSHPFSLSLPNAHFNSPLSLSLSLFHSFLFLPLIFQFQFFFLIYFFLSFLSFTLFFISFLSLSLTFFFVLLFLFSFLPFLFFLCPSLSSLYFFFFFLFFLFFSFSVPHFLLCTSFSFFFSSFSFLSLSLTFFFVLLFLFSFLPFLFFLCPSLFSLYFFFFSFLFLSFISFLFIPFFFLCLLLFVSFPFFLSPI
ncbi:Protein DD3-3 [Acanthosepion pharaonis]|uniref:Protein DD3-3 n=1 Tax=Acanthosepion pharaonis TaxID=158019 RepID=A0A812C134_ACAPH|nr:Protein DD3-3 [Sepia pharaonis]